MAVTEQTRYNVHKHFEGTMGQELAATLMEMLPGVGWGDVARRSDIDRLDRRLDALEVKFDAKFDALEAKFEESFRTYLVANVAITCTIIGVVGAAARFL